ncbi:universal stress protein [Microbacterium fluvii]|uniref:Universal stress protein n=1 Tax=Microbacterium fluvii TaxID=415215 RepID=A0ABW2HAU2_9MICO|nr:universal stress protein [Microbacterium fluvii]MCU4671183.1 universal stress protein [Microbacterium fluvii]
MGDIFVGVTDADASRRAVDWAAQRAVDLGARLVLVSVAPEAPDPAEISPAFIVIEAERQRVEAEFAGVECDVLALHGNPVAELVEASKHADLLVIGDAEPGRHWGDHGRHIVSSAHVTVAVVPDVDLAGRAGVVVGIDGSEVTERALAFAASEAERRGEPLIAVGAWMPVIVDDTAGLGGFGYIDATPIDLQQPTTALVAEALAPVRAAHPELEIDERIIEGDPATMLAHAAENAALLVVGTHGRGTLARLFLGSVSDAVLTSPVTPTLAVR